MRNSIIRKIFHRTVEGWTDWIGTIAGLATAA
jgi:hypothetical protein